MVSRGQVQPVSFFFHSDAFLSLNFNIYRKAEKWNSCIGINAASRERVGWCRRGDLHSRSQAGFLCLTAVCWPRILLSYWALYEKIKSRLWVVIMVTKIRSFGLSFWLFLLFHHGKEKEVVSCVKTALQFQRKSWSNVQPKLHAGLGFLCKLYRKLAISEFSISPVSFPFRRSPWETYPWNLAHFFIMFLATRVAWNFMNFNFA